MSSIDPPERVSALARRMDLGKPHRRVQRRPGVPGALICCVFLIVALNLLFAGPPNAIMVTAATVLLLIIVWWGYVWFHRTRGGLYIFDNGFIDVAGRRLIGVLWTEMVSITVGRTQYAVGSLPAGQSTEYQLRFRRPPRTEILGFHINSTYDGVTEVAELFARRSRLTITARSPGGQESAG